MFRRVSIVVRLPRVSIFHDISRGLALRVVGLSFICAALMAPVREAGAVTELRISEGDVQTFLIAIPDFSRGGRNSLGKRVVRTVRADLRRSGLFTLIDTRSILAMPAVHAKPSFDRWRGLGAEILVVGRVMDWRDGRIEAEFRMWDLLAGQEMEGQKFFTSVERWSHLAHAVSNSIYQRLTGEPGYFDTKIAFVAEHGPKNRRVKRLAVMDWSGENLRYLSDGRELILTPRFSPDGREIVCVVLVPGQGPRVVLFDVASGYRRLLGDFPGMTFAPRFSPNGRDIAMSMQIAENANLYAVNPRDRIVTRLTAGKSLNTAPSYAPGGRRLTFESDRGGRPQIYVMNADGSGQRLISPRPGAYSTPVWSPKGDLIAFTKRVGGRFQIGVMRPDGSGERILTDGFHNEGPAWGPNGRMLMFFREEPGLEGGPYLWAIDADGARERRIATPGFASDPAWSFPLDRTARGGR